jgi:hypothetical protein
LKTFFATKTLRQERNVLSFLKDFLFENENFCSEKQKNLLHGKSQQSQNPQTFELVSKGFTVKHIQFKGIFFSNSGPTFCFFLQEKKPCEQKNKLTCEKTKELVTLLCFVIDMFLILFSNQSSVFFGEEQARRKTLQRHLVHLCKILQNSHEVLFCASTHNQN